MRGFAKCPYALPIPYAGIVERSARRRHSSATNTYERYRGVTSSVFCSRRDHLEESFYQRSVSMPTVRNSKNEDVTPKGQAEKRRRDPKRPRRPGPKGRFEECGRVLRRNVQMKFFQSRFCSNVCIPPMGI